MKKIKERFAVAPQTIIKINTREVLMYEKYFQS